MRLTHFSADGLKNLRDIDLDIPHLLALSGPNGSGKTAILQGIRLAILGHDPEKGKTLSATRELASDDRGIDVGLTFDTGFGIHRILGKSTETEVAPPDGESTERERQARIDAETGAFPFSFDLGHFLALSAEKRRDFLFELLPRGGADLDEDTFRSWLGYDDADEVIQRGIDHLWQGHVVKAQTAIDGLATAIESAHEKMLAAERARQTAVTISADADRDAQEASEAVAEFDEEELELLQAEVATVEQRLGEIRQATEDAERQERQHAHQVRVAEMRRSEAREDLGALRLQLDQVDAVDGARITEASQRLISAREAVDQADSVPAEDLERLRQLAKEEELAKDARAKVPADAAKAEAELAACRRDAHALRNRLQPLLDTDACPVCGNETDLASARAEIRAELEAVEEHALELVAAIEEYQSRRASLDSRVREATAALETARADVDAEASRRRRELQAELDEATRMVNALRSASDRRQSLASQIEAAEKRLDRADAELQDLRQAAPDGPAGHSEERDRLSARATDLRQRMTDLQAAARAYGKAEALREQADRKRRDLETATYRAEAYKQLHAGLQGLRARAIESMVGPVQARAAEILEAIDPAKRFAFRFEREGRPVLDFGFEEGGVFRSYDAASKGEDAFLAVVLVAATISVTQPTWPVLMVDDAEGIDADRRAALQGALARPEIADLFGNVILAGACPFVEVGGWTVLEIDQLTRGATAEAAA